ncbi:Uncharacterised protein [Vibrio cholerae]|nr:Uncharacterised protein [Vibrio cholerae]CSD77213.1 Uncharacterised protein [Vibrio cholerae]CSI21799.1 Uncharacterised protein [Vibrio cholerae]CSI43547.1 Uncharacterised protein [Vibrio cholerae]
MLVSRSIFSLSLSTIEPYNCFKSGSEMVSIGN